MQPFILDHTYASFDVLFIGVFERGDDENKLTAEKNVLK